MGTTGLEPVTVRLEGGKNFYNLSLARVLGIA